MCALIQLAQLCSDLMCVSYSTLLPPPVPAEAFNNVEWSTSGTCLSQMRRIQSLHWRVGLGDTYHDVDTYEDLVALKARMASGAVTAECTSEFLAKTVTE